MSLYAYCAYANIVSVGLQTVWKNPTEQVDFGMSCLTLAFLNISMSSLSLSQVKALIHIGLNLPRYFSTQWKKHSRMHHLFNFLGQCWAHQSCALWSEGVFQGEGQSLLNVDRAIYSGSTKVSQTRTFVD